MVSAACVFPEGVAAEKRLPQAVEAPLAELTHGARIFDSVSILLCGTVPLPAGVLCQRQTCCDVYDIRDLGKGIRQSSRIGAGCADMGCIRS
jgi:hypothetical protein